MSDKQFEPCTLEEATHVEMGGKMYELDVWESGGACKDYEEGHCVGITVDDKNEIVSIPIFLFPILGIKPMRERKREPIEFEAIVKASMASYFFLGNVPEGVPLGTKFKCVEILEEGK